MGLATLALGFGGHLALLGLTLHLLSHGLAKSTVFLAAGRLVTERGSRRIARLAGAWPAPRQRAGVARRRPCCSPALPPSGIFVAEIAIVLGGFQAGWGVGRRRRRCPARAGGGRAALPCHAGVGGAAGIHRRGTSRLTRWAILLGLPLTAVVVVGLWTPTPLTMALEQVVLVLGGGRG